MRTYEQKEKSLFKPVMTFEEIADIMGITRQRAEQLEKSALRNARKILRNKGYNPNLFFSDPTYKRPLTDKQVKADGLYGGELHIIETLGEGEDGNEI
jgi:hypothetical protein